MKYLQGAALAAGILGSAAAFGQTAGNPTPPTQPPASSPTRASRLSGSDQDFVNKAAIGGLFEVEAGKIAAKKASNPKVRQFAERMVRDHSEAGNKLKRLVSADGGTVPNELDPEHQQALQQLTSQQGSDFDRNYMQTMVKDHDTDAQEFARAAQGLDDAKLRTFAQETLKVIDQHAKMAHEITARMASK